MGVLKAYDEELLRVITTTLYSNNHLLLKEDLGTLSSILVSLMKLQYKYLELIDSIVDIFMSGPKDAKMSDEEIIENLPVDLLSFNYSCVCFFKSYAPTMDNRKFVWYCSEENTELSHGGPKNMVKYSVLFGCVGKGWCCSGVICT